MKDSDTYQAILDEGRVEGRVEEARKFLQLLAEKRLGSPDARTKATLESIADLKRIEELGERLLDVSSWQELLATSQTQGRGSPRRKKPS